MYDVTDKEKLEMCSTGNGKLGNFLKILSLTKKINMIMIKNSIHTYIKLH